MDPFTQLLKTWQPSSPYSEKAFVDETLRQIHAGSSKPLKRRPSLLEELLEWLPSPRVFIPAAAALLLLMSAISWLEAGQRARTFAALRWHEQLNQPMSSVSLAGSYAELRRSHL